MSNSPRIKKPDWLRIKLPSADEYSAMKSHLNKNKLHTICESGNCPNRATCWHTGTATFLILGNICSRNCKFCDVKSGKPSEPDIKEPESVAEAVFQMKLKHCVITSVTRDDLADGGAEIWAETIKAVRRKNFGITIETLIPDFNGNANDITKVMDAKPDIISHNLETVKRLTPSIRSKASYAISLNVIKIISDFGIRSKSGIMLGLGENENDIVETMHDLLNAGCEVLTLGQYLQPSRINIPVREYIEPQRFEKYKQMALMLGFPVVESGPLVRSSFNSHLHLR